MSKSLAGRYFSIRESPVGRWLAAMPLFHGQGGEMYYKKPYHDFFELVAIVRIYVLQKRADGDLDVQFEMADGSTLESIYTLAEYGDLIAHPEGVVV